MEKEKMLKGEIYNSRDPELLERYHTARDLLRVYNNLSSRSQEIRRGILLKLLGGVGEGVWIEAPFFCDYGENIFIGKNSFINMNCIFLDEDIFAIVAMKRRFDPYIFTNTTKQLLEKSISDILISRT